MAKTRSPNFPYVPLETALQRSHILWDQEGRHAAAAETIVDHWGYSPKSSGGRQTLAALRHFGLLEGRAALGLRLTELAQAILFSEQGSDEWLQRVQEAALKPAIHQEIWAKYGGDLPSDQNLRYHLVVERGFAETGAMELIQELRATLSFARLGQVSGDILSPESEGEGEVTEVTNVQKIERAEAPSIAPLGGMRAVQLPYAASAWATLQASFPLTDAEWAQMIAVLNAMKPALTEPRVGEPGSNGEPNG